MPPAPLPAPDDRTDRHPDNDPLLRWTERIADGQAVDWEDVERELEPALVQGLRQLAALAGGFGAVATEPVPPQSDTLPPGTRFGPLEIVDVLGRGAYGAVYRARDAQLDREVALKILGHPSLTRAELLREGQLMARIDHPNVLKVYGAVEDSGQVGFACELMPGESMEEWLARQGTLGAHELVAIGGELCAALCALHRGNILHGDLKPSNVLRHADGRWVVADFGSSQYAHDAFGSSGTPLYMAPERFRQQAPTAASDQYSLGVLLFRLATRRFPFEAETTAELENRHGANQRRRLLDLRPDLPRALVAAIERALAVDAPRRHASIGAFAAALAEALPAAVAQRPRRRWLWAGVAAALVLVALAGLLRPPPTSDGGLHAQWLRTSHGGEEILRAGTAVGPGDTLALRLSLDRSRHVYVINEDQLGARFQLFPLAGSELANPLPAGEVRLPGRHAGADVDWRITSRGGRERFFLLLADEPLLDLQALALAQPDPLATDDGLYAASETVRGVGGLAPRASEIAAGEAEWLQRLRERYPLLDVEQFELANP